MLFISDNIKIAIIRNTLQSMLKPRINIEPDFDSGLNNVFEKRPTLVFIQEQIAGVTGESVARHIQLLLGSAAPLLVLMHDGNAKAKPIKGLYEHLIDLSQEEAKLIADIQGKLELLLGPHWHKLYIVPKMPGSADEAALAPLEEYPGGFSQCIADFIPDIEPIGPASTTTAPALLILSQISPDESFEIISSTDDQLAEILSEESRRQEATEVVSTAEGNVTPGKISSPAESMAPPLQNKPSALLAEISPPAVGKAAVFADKPSSVSATSAPVVKAAPTVQKPAVTVPPIPGVSGKLQSPPDSPADLSADRKDVLVEVAQDEIQWAFEGDQRITASTWKWYQVVELLLVLCLVVGGWYLIKQKLHPSQSGAKETTPAIVSAPLSAGQQSEAAAQQQPETVALPSFIPLTGLDPSFAAQNSGWERYVGAESEFRLFRTAGRLKAVQVIAAKGRNLSESMLKAMLIELTGAGEYRVTSKEQKLGFQVLKATASNKAELLIYRKRSALHAVVVSLD